MNFKNLERVLKVKNDVCNLSEEELKKEYFDNDENYKELLGVFCIEFLPIEMFPLMITDKYDFLENNIKEKIDSGVLTENDSILSKNILLRIDGEKKAVNGNTENDKEQFFNINLERIGALKLKDRYKNYNEYVKSLYENVKTYNSLKNEEFPDSDELSEVMEIGNVLYNTCPKKVAENYFVEMTKNYSSLKLCYNPRMLVFLNYALNKIDDEEEYKKLIYNTKNIIETTIYNPDFSVLYNKNYDFKEYLKVSKLVSKKIRRYEKEEMENNKVKKYTI